MSWMGRDPRLSFGAIRAEGEHLEYSLPGGVVDAMGARKAMAFCQGDVEQFVKNVRSTIRRESAKVNPVESDIQFWTEIMRQRQMEGDAKKAEYAALMIERLKAKTATVSSSRGAKTAASKASTLTDVLDEIEREVAQLRSMGVRGPIPVCVYRSSGKKGRAGDWQLIQNQSHERFHAAVRRLEVSMGARHHGFSSALDKAFKEEFGNDGWFLSYTLKWANTPDTIIEELLARVEEQALACVHSTDACRENSEYNAQWVDLFNQRVGNRLLRTYLETLTADVLNRYGSAMGFVKAAVAKYPQLVLR